MKKALAIFIILQLFTNHEAFAEMAKIPFLFIHYKTHHHQGAFTHFLKDHYSTDPHAGSDHEHGKLPFKHSDDGCSHHPLPNISVVTKTETNFTFQLALYRAQEYRLNNDNLYSCYYPSIWQPPKLS